MKSLRVCLLLFLLSTLNPRPSTLFAQGSLTPPAAPTPTMKSLDQVQPRTPVDGTHTPGDGSDQFVISSPGSYYLTSNVLGASGKNGIAINADNVTLDLNGFALIGAGGSLNGVNVASAHQNIIIMNGTAEAWGANGINAANATNAQLTVLQVSANGQAGIVAGTSCIVRNCGATGNGADGIRVTGMTTRVEENNSNSNGASGIRTDAAGSLVIRNNATLNSVTDYNMANGTSYGQILMVPGANFTSTSAWANFSSSCPAGQTFCGGTCSNLTGDPNNCGACGNVCNVANGTAACNSSNCTIGTCNAGYADCDRNVANGCEVHTNTDVNNCGACGTVCAPRQNSTPTCTSGSCGISCNPGYGDCDGNQTNGCEINLNTNVNNCGFCGTICNAPNGVAACSSGTCSVASCNSGYANCNGLSSDGCEVHTTVDPNNCGGCGVVCSSNHMSAVTCGGGICNGTCATGYADCDGNRQTDGCEVNTTNDANNCGSCGNRCASGHSCVSSVCQ